MKQRKLLFWSLLALFAVLCGWWIVYFPYDRAGLYRAIPDQPVYVAVHERLGERWPVLTRNTAVRAALYALSGARDRVDDWIGDPRVEPLMRLLAAKETVVGYLPGPGARDAELIVASWVGWRGQFLRWGGLSKALGPSCDKRRLWHGVDAWTLRIEDDVLPPYLSVAVAEGILMAAISPDPLAVQRVAQRIQRGAPLVPGLARHMASAGNVPGADTDTAWVTWTGFEEDGQALQREIRVGMNFPSTTVVNGWIGWRTGMPVPIGETRTWEWDAMACMVGDPCVLLAAGASNALAMVERAGGEAVKAAARVIAPVIRMDRPVVCHMHDRALNGQIMGLAVPSLVIEAELEDAAVDLGAFVSGGLDSVNASCGWQLIPRVGTTNDYVYAVVESARSGVYASTRAGEKVSLTVRDGRLLVSSNEKAMHELLSDRSLPGGAWRLGIEQAKGAPCGWATLGRGCQAVRNALAVYSLMLGTTDRAANRQARQNLAVARGWLQRFGPIGEMAVWADPENRPPRIRFRLAPSLEKP